MKKINLGIIAHVDSGKTTLSEAMLYISGARRSFGRVDKGTAFLDNAEVEQKRGITVFSKQAGFEYENTSFVLTDTPGHADLIPETERALRIMDYAVLLVSAPEGIKPRTKTMWELIAAYNIPVFVFFNKTDQPFAGKGALMDAARKDFGDGAVEFSSVSDLTEDQLERIALCDEAAMEEFLSEETLKKETIARLVKERKLFPCFFGSALHTDGVKELLDALDTFTVLPVYPEEFSAEVFKIARESDERLTFLKVTGGELKARMLLPDGEGESKINQIRFYSGKKYVTADIAKAGDVCAVTGLKSSRAGDIFGNASAARPEQVISPVMSCAVIPEKGKEPADILPLLRIMEEENPELGVSFDENKKEINVSVMGNIQLEILSGAFKERFGIEITFTPGKVLYKETIAEPVIGAGHFEPLRHYAEVQLLMEPLPRGKGLVFESAASTDRLALNWQRLILTHLREKQHKGVLTGSPVTDMKITLIEGRAHLKHTEGGDFRQAVYRAVRQGLMMTENVLLEPYYRFSLELPLENAGRAMTDLTRLSAKFALEEAAGGEGTAVITGRGPVSTLKEYPAAVSAYTRGSGVISFAPDGYDICRNAEEVIAEKAYDPLSDIKNSPDSVFCSHGAGHIVPYNEVYEHLDIPLEAEDGEQDAPAARPKEEIWLGTEEIDAIIAGTTGSNSSPKKAARIWRKKHAKASESRNFGPANIKNTYVPAFAVENAEILLVDAYNVIFAWDELKELAKDGINAAADAVMDILDRYASLVSAEVTAVFDAYRVKNHARETMKYKGINVVYTGEDETADRYIEKFTNEYARKKRIAVVTSDSAERTITRGQGCVIISSAEFKEHIKRITGAFNERFNVN